MQRLDLNNAREDARSVLRQRINEKEKIIAEEHSELRKRNSGDSASSRDIKHEEVFAPEPPSDDYLKMICVVGIGFLVFLLVSLVDSI